jgi:hypothetical protein
MRWVGEQMKKIFKSNIFCFILGGILFSTVTVYAAIINAKDVAFEPENTTFKVDNVKTALDFLYEHATKGSFTGGEMTYVYHDLKIYFDPETLQVRHEYEGKEVFPIYWYGYMPNASYMGTFGLTTWNETNSRTSISYQKEKMVVQRSVTTSSSYCVGGITLGYKVNFGSYSTFGVIIDSATVAGNAHYAPYTGNVGNNLGNEGNAIGSFAQSSSPQKLRYNIAGVSGSYYPALRTWCKGGTIEIGAMWLES